MIDALVMDLIQIHGPDHARFEDRGTHLSISTFEFNL